MNNAVVMSRKVGKLSGKLVELGKFGQRGTELQYEFLKMVREDGDTTTLRRIAIPAELNRLLEMKEFIDLFLTRRGLWHFCYGVRSGEKSAESYRGYRFFFIFNRLMMYLNLMFGVYLLMTPGLAWAGAGLVVFGLLFLFLGPASPRRMHALFAASTSPRADQIRSQAESAGGGNGDRPGS
jgi:hypothetical protein